MKIRWILLLLFFVASACADQISVSSVEYLPITDLGKYNMKILPESPTSVDNVRLVIFDDCQYNLLDGVKKSGNTISIEKHFNSMMMLPCMLRNDTIEIGKLPAGTYRVNYRLVDMALQPDGKTSIAISFNLLVSK
jgi:hypothetical protein